MPMHKRCWNCNTVNYSNPGRAAFCCFACGSLHVSDDIPDGGFELVRRGYGVWVRSNLTMEYIEVGLLEESSFYGTESHQVAGNITLDGRLAYQRQGPLWTGPFVYATHYDYQGDLQWAHQPDQLEDLWMWHPYTTRQQGWTNNREPQPLQARNLGRYATTKHRVMHVWTEIAMRLMNNSDQRYFTYWAPRPSGDTQNEG